MAEEGSEENILQGALKNAFNFLNNPPKTEIKTYFKTGEGEDAHFQLTSYEKKEDEEKTKVLEPEHPLLAKFQKALKHHLERQIDHLKNEIFEYETGAKKKIGEKDQIGVDAYETQQIVSKQQTNLENCIRELQDIEHVKTEMQAKLEVSLATHKSETQSLFETEKKEIELRKEMDAVNLLVQQMSNWEEDIESDLKVNQRMFEKTKKDKLKLAEEKRQQDMLVYKLMTTVWELEAELETICMQLRVKEEEREKLAQTIAISNTDIDASETEHRCLMHGWNSVIIAISSRDKHFNAVNQELNAHTERLRSLLSEIEQLKKLSKREMNHNETLTMFKNRIETDMNNCKHQLELEENKRDNLERTMLRMQAIIDQTESDFSRLASENHGKSNEVSHVRKDFEKLYGDKVALEMEILTNMQDQITNDKASKYLGKMLSQTKTRNRAMEIRLGCTENANALVLMDIECQKGINEDLARRLDDLIKQRNMTDQQINHFDLDFHKGYSLVNKKQRDIDLLSSRLEKLKSSGMGKVSPAELKISALEQHIEHVQEKNKDMQKFWLREQGHIVLLTEQRQEQIRDSNILRKQTMILEQRNLKVNDELDLHRKQERQVQHNINKLQNRLLRCTETLSIRKGSKSCLDENNFTLQNEFIVKLKSEELAIVKMEADLVDIQNDISTLSNDLLEKNREALEWEKKLKMVLETKHSISEEKGTGGEIGSMRVEIHRMNVRYGQLKKAQEKLIADLEHCVSRRDAIVTNAEAREKRMVGVQSKVMFSKKLDDVRNKLRYTQNEIESAQRTIANYEEEIQQTQQGLIDTHDNISTTKIKCVELQNEVEETKMQKQMKLEVLLMQQRKCKIFSELTKGRQPYLQYRTEERVSTEYEHQKNVNDKLQYIVENLMSDFPSYTFDFHRMLNTLKLSMIIV